MYREAVFNGPGTGRGVGGDWFLEVKRYENFGVDQAVVKLTGQVDSHFKRTFQRGVDKIDDPPSWKGLVYDFVEDGGNLSAFKDAILEQAARSIKKHANNPSRAIIREYLLERMKVNGQTFNPTRVDEVLDLIGAT